jgi:hypothetical protein
MQGKVALDVAKLAGVPLGTPKTPIPKGSVAFAGILALGFSFWTYWIDRNGFVWYSVSRESRPFSFGSQFLG